MVEKCSKLNVNLTTKKNILLVIKNEIGLLFVKQKSCFLILNENKY